MLLLGKANMEESIMPETNHDTMDDVLETYKDRAARPGTGEYFKGRQKFWVPVCSACGDFTRGKLYTLQSVAWTIAMNHVRRVHVEAQ